jgi:fructan beta-fructosidase
MDKTRIRSVARTAVLVWTLAFCSVAKAQQESGTDSIYRPFLHFTPAAHWMNDPNGLVYSKGVYHLFYQYYPGGNVWGPMHWGHAQSQDLISWQHQPIALYPDSIGMIFSGSAVIDHQNTAGFGKDAMVAIYTQHDSVGEKAKTSDFQNQSIAYSLDNGHTWTKYQKNPVLKNPGFRDFRDPKVSWFEATRRWIMTLAVGDEIFFYSSPDLKQWTKESQFGKSIGAHGGVWECPDLFPLTYKGKRIWVLLVNLNPGGPNGGSATQYFLGDFDGHQFKPTTTTTQWADYGPDEYAGVTYAETGAQRIFQGWMSNWDYATVVPTTTWRSAMTIPRTLRLVETSTGPRLASMPVAQLSARVIGQPVVGKVGTSDEKQFNDMPAPYQAEFSFTASQAISITLGNNANDKLEIGFDPKSKQFFIDRSASGIVDFKKGFAAKHVAPRFSNTQNVKLTIIVDAASVEMFADDGLTVMTEIFFPHQPMTSLTIQGRGAMYTVKKFRL